MFHDTKKHWKVSYLSQYEGIQSVKRGSRQENYKQKKWYTSLNRLVTVEDFIDHYRENHKDIEQSSVIVNPLSSYNTLQQKKIELDSIQVDRIKSSFELEDYVANKHGKYFLLKYDIISRNQCVTDYMDFFMFLCRMRNNIRMKKDIDDFILYNNYCIDVSKQKELHMHLFLYGHADWLTGRYEIDKLVYKSKIIDLNKWMVKLIRSDKKIGDCLINIPDERTDMMDSLTGKDDVFARNDNRDYLTYLSKVDVDYVNALNYSNTCRIRLFGRSNIPQDFLESRCG